jgi:hypothetical protein
MTKWIAYFCFPALCALLSAGVGAQTLYKSTMPDGRVIFSDAPAPGAAKVEPIKTETSKAGTSVEPTKADSSKAAGKKTAPVDPAVVKKLRDDKAKRERAEEQARAAEKALRTAEAALAKGEEPLPGERTGTVSGKSRLNEDYWKRQRQLKDNVENARANLEKARAQVR